MMKTQINFINLLRNGLTGEYVLQSVTIDKFKGVYIFNFKEKRKE
jgi:hypothetical protein